MDFWLLCLQVFGAVIWLLVMAPSVLVVSVNFISFSFLFKTKWLIMTPLCMMQGIKQWKKSTLTGDALCVALLLSPYNILSFNTFLALIVSIMTLMVNLGLNVTNATSHSIYNVGHGSQKLLSRQSTSCVLFTAVDSSNCVGLDSRLLCNVLLAIA